MRSINYETIRFSEIQIQDLDVLTKSQADRLSFGVVGLSKDNRVELYNQTEAKLAGMPESTVLGEHFFLAVAQCMNNFMVAQRFEDEPKLDATIDYVLTFRMRPTPVTLRLLKSQESSRRYILVHR